MLRSDPPSERSVVDLFQSRAGHAVRLARYPPGERQPPHAHATSSVALILAGEVDERCGASCERGSALSVSFKPSRVEHEDSFGAYGALVLQISVSPERTSRRDPLDAWRWEHGSALARPMLRLLELAADGAPRGGRAAEAERCVLEALRMAAHVESPAKRSPPPWLLEVHAVLADQPFPIAELAAQARVHPVLLAREFRRHFRTSPREHRRLQRLCRCARLLTGTQRPLTDVALESGYSDQPHMTREVRTHLGVTPHVLRRCAAWAAESARREPVRTVQDLPAAGL